MNFDAPIRSTPNIQEFRTHLKHYLDVAIHEAVRVQRRSGDNFIVIKESNYKALIHELIHLQRKLLRMAPVFHKAFMDFHFNEDNQKSNLKDLFAEVGLVKSESEQRNTTSNIKKLQLVPKAVAD